jgi:hypothetical protein
MIVKEHDILLLRDLTGKYGPKSFPGRGVHYLFAWLIADYRKLREAPAIPATAPSSPPGLVAPHPSAADTDAPSIDSLPATVTFPSEPGTSITFTAGGPMVVNFDRPEDARIRRLVDAGYKQVDEVTVAFPKAIAIQATARMISFRIRSLLAGQDFNAWMAANEGKL